MRHNELKQLGVVVIGRNEGDRLLQCLTSVASFAPCVVYVDSGSTDNSIEIADQLNVNVVELDLSTPFTAARARNTGYRKVMELAPDVNWIQFVDGDCEVVQGWLLKATRFLEQHDNIAAVSGRRRERYPQASIYNQLCEIEWENNPGPAKYCGGDVMIRATALEAVSGYNEALIAGEEPELCVRLRQSGWGIHILKEEMTLHDADMKYFSQWWNRMKRSGWAYAAGAHMHGSSPERHWVWQCAQAWIWGLGPLVLVLGLTPFIGFASLMVLLVYPLQWCRLALNLSGPMRSRCLEASAYIVGRFAELQGQMTYIRQVLVGQKPELIEYK